LKKEGGERKGERGLTTYGSGVTLPGVEKKKTLHRKGRSAGGKGTLHDGRIEEKKKANFPNRCWKEEEAVRVREGHAAGVPAKRKGRRVTRNRSPKKKKQWQETIPERGAAKSGRGGSGAIDPVKKPQKGGKSRLLQNSKDKRSLRKKTLTSTYPASRSAAIQNPYYIQKEKKGLKLEGREPRENTTPDKNEKKKEDSWGKARRKERPQRGKGF